jgi:hypothetical protein
MKSCKTCLRGPDRSDHVACKGCDDELSHYVATFDEPSGYHPQCYGRYMIGPDASERECGSCTHLSDCRLDSTYTPKQIRTPDGSQVAGDHYTRLSIQPWAAMEAWLTPDAFCGFLQGNVIKYVARDKDDKLTDLKKAKHYLEKLIHTLERGHA